MKREALIYYSYKYQGNYDRIVKAIYLNEPYLTLKAQAITILDDEYPLALKVLANPPFVIYYKGDLSLLKKAMIAIVGSRNHSLIANKYTNIITSKIKSKYVVVSGLAKGIDTLAHQACLDSGTIAILGCGIDYIYPYENKKLYGEIVQKGLILSEFPAHTKPLSRNFPFRNRLIVALSKALIVIESKLQSGTHTSVNWALEQGKEVYVCPYGFDSSDNCGNHYLIKEGANLLEIGDLDDI